MTDRSNRHSATGSIGTGDLGDDAGFDTNLVNAAAFDALVDAPPHEIGAPPPRDTSAPIRQVVFIDGSVPDAQLLAKGVAPGVVAVILAPDRDGVAQIAGWLAAHNVSNLAAIDIVAHGADGTVALGSAVLDSATLPGYAAALASIGAALAPGGAIQLYGCDVAQDAAGDAFLQQLSAATGGASVAAASHEVGAVSGGGSWTLDFNTGTVDAAVPFSQAAISAYPDELALTSNQLYVLFDAETEPAASPNTALIGFSLSGGTVVANGTYTAKTTIVSNTTSLEGPQSVAIDAPQTEYYIVNNDYTDGIINIVRGSLSGGGISTVLTVPDLNTYSIGDIALDQPSGYLYYTLTNFGTLGDPGSVSSGIYKIPISSLTGTIAFPGTAVATFPGTVTYESPFALALDLSQNLIFFSNTDFADIAPNDLDVATTSGRIQTLTGQLPASVQNELSVNNPDEAVLVGLAVDPVHDELYIAANAGSAYGVGYIFKAAYSVNGGGTVTIGTVSTLYAGAASEYPQTIQIDTADNVFFVSGNAAINSNTFEAYVYEGSLNGGVPLKQIYQATDSTGLGALGALLLSQPTLAVSGSVNYPQGASAVVLDGTATDTNPDGTNLDGATIAIAAGFSNGDTLSVSLGGGITGSYSNGVYTLTGNASAAQYQTVLDSTKFSSTSVTGGTRTIDWTVTNGVITSATGVSSVVVHTAPTIAAGATVTFTGGGSPAVLDSVLAITDSSGTIQTSATVTIGNFLSTDTLTVGTPGGLASSFSNGVLTLTGTASTATYQTALDSVTFTESPSNSDPTADNTRTSHAITFSINNGFVQSAGATSTVNLVHTPPTITAGATATFTGGGAAVILDSGLAVTDPDSGGVLSSATVTIGSPITGDTLNFSNTNSTTEGNVAVASDSGGVLVLTSSGSTATLAQWQTALEAVTYSVSPTSTDPTGGGTHTSRTITYSVNDGAASSAAATSTLKTVHAAPTVTAGSAITYVIGNAPATLDSTLALSDLDSGGLIQSATVSVAGGTNLGDILATNTVGFPSITANYTAGNETLTLTGSDTLADYQAALRFVTISGTTAGTRTIDYTVNDGAASSAVATSSATIEAVPTITASGTVAYHQGGTTPVVLDAGLTVTDPSDSVLSSATVTIGGFLSGDTLTVGTPGGLSTAFNSGALTVSGVASLATYQAALDSVAYLFTPASGDPTNGFTDDTRTISWQATDTNSNTSTIAASSLNVACFRSGTRIATPTGQIAVQHLAVGDLVMTADGAERPVIWAGRRVIDCTRHPRPAKVWPVRIPAGAFGPACPSRDLFLSPDHAVLVDDVLIPVCRLIGAAGIQQVPVDQVTYFHIELPAHDIILAEDLPAESYLDTGNRAIFEQGGGAITLYPDFVARNWELFGCAPLVVCGPQLQAARNRLDAAAEDTARSRRHGGEGRSIALAG